MPTKRARRAHGHRAGVPRVDRLTEAQREHLLLGGNYIWWDSGPPFVSDEHRREAWRRHREALLAEWNRAGERPDALWAYDATLPDEVPEAEAVHALLRQGAITPCTRDGIHAVADELAHIEAQWLRSIENAFRGTTDPDKVRRQVCNPGSLRLASNPAWVVPGWFYDEHGPRVLARRLSGGLKPW